MSPEWILAYRCFNTRTIRHDKHEYRLICDITKFRCTRHDSLIFSLIKSVGMRAVYAVYKLSTTLLIALLSERLDLKSVNLKVIWSHASEMVTQNKFYRMS